MHGNEAVYAKLRSSACMSIVSPVDAYGLIGTNRAPFCTVGVLLTNPVQVLTKQS